MARGTRRTCLDAKRRGYRAMPNAPIFMRAAGPSALRAARMQSSATFAAAAPAAAATRMTTTVAEARLAQPEAVARVNPILAREMIKIRAPVVDVIGTGPQGDTRDKMTVPVSPVPEPTDAV